MMFLAFYWFPITVFVISILILVWIRYVSSHHHVFSKLGIPGPRPSFLVGNVTAFANKFPMDVFKQWTDEFGSVFGFYEGLRPSVVVCCPDLAQKILVKHFNKFSTRPVINPFMHEYEDLSLQNVSGQLWKRQRQAVSSGMTAKSIREMFPVISAVTGLLISWLEQASTTSPSGFFIDDVIERYAIDWFSQAALGYHSDALTNKNNIFLRYMRASHESMSPENTVTGLAKLFPRLTSILKPLDRQHRTLAHLQATEVTHFVRSLKTDILKLSVSSCHSIIYNLMTKKVSTICSTQGGTENKGASDNSHKSYLEESEVVGEVSGLVGGGVGPFSSTLTFCLYCLAAYPREQDRIRAELETFTSIKNGLSVDDLHRLRFLDRFIQETLRCFPVAPGVSRECIEDCTISGVPFRRGMVVRVMFSCMYRQEKHFTQPELFNPDRFLASCDKSDSLDDAHHATAFMPFGLGPRMCVGRRLAQVALKLALCKIVQNFRIDCSGITQVPLQVALRPFLVSRDGVHLKMHRNLQ